MSLFRVCVLFMKVRQRGLLEDGIRFSPSSPHPGGAFCVVGGSSSEERMITATKGYDVED